MRFVYLFFAQAVDEEVESNGDNAALTVNSVGGIVNANNSDDNIDIKVGVCSVCVLAFCVMWCGMVSCGVMWFDVCGVV